MNWTDVISRDIKTTSNEQNVTNNDDWRRTVSAKCGQAWPRVISRLRNDRYFSVFALGCSPLSPGWGTAASLRTLF